VRDLLTPGTTVRNITLYGCPFCTRSASFGRFVGGAVWKPLAEFDVPTTGQKPPTKDPPRVRDTSPAPGGRVHLERAGSLGRVIAAPSSQSRGRMDECHPEFRNPRDQGKLSILTAWEDQVSYGEVFSFRS